MKRMVSSLLVVCLVVICGCSGSSQGSGVHIVDGAYNLTPEEYITMMNQTMAAQEDGDYLTIPDWDEAVANSIFVTLSFDVGFGVNEEGKITRIAYHWKNTTEAANTAAFLVGVTINMIAAENANDVAEQLNMFDFKKKSYENTCEMNGSSFYYLSAEYGDHNWFSVDVIE